MKKNRKVFSLLILITLTFSGVFAFSKLQSLKAATSDINKTLEQLKILTEVFDYISQNYVSEKEAQGLIYGAAHGMVRTLDPFSQFLEPEPHQNMKTDTEGQFGGLGIRIEMRDDWLTVMTPIPDTPAYRAGMLPNDKIIKIEGKSTQGITLQGAVKKLRGKPGTKVTITIVHEGIKEPLDITITREIIKIQSVRYRMMEYKIGYIQLIEFSAKTENDAKKALKKMKKNGMESLVLDLRNNPGGLLNIAVGITKQFLGDNKLVVYTQGRRSKRVEYRSNSRGEYEKIPLVVLVNGGSASGSEIVAGALQDHHRALIVGATTFGKASVQSVIPLSDGSGLRLTTAKYYTPSGRMIMRDKETGQGGIGPDIVVKVPREMEIKIRRQQEKIFSKGKAPKSFVDEKDQVIDLALQRAIEFLRAQAILSGTYNADDQPQANKPK